MSIGGLVAGFGIGIELQSNNCYVDKCNIIHLQQGVYVNTSDNNLITNNVIALNTQYGIHINLVDVCTISGNSLVANTLHGIYVNDSAYVIMSHNGCFNNLQSGIYLNQSDYNTISACACNSNLQNGVYIGNQSHYNTISSNTCSNNDSNTANFQGGIVIADDSDYNTISANSCNNNNNVGAGDGFGIIIHAATCLESMVAANNANGNDIDFQDSGTDTTIEYFVQDEFELQDAINSIGTKSGIINLEGSFTINATILIDAITGGGSYIIRGAGSNTTLTSADITCFHITSARSVLLENFKIDASVVTGRNTTIIKVDEAADNLIIIDNVAITGIVGRGWGIEVNSDYVQIRNCKITTIDMGIRIYGDYCKAESNTCNGMDEYGIRCSGDYVSISKNICNSSGRGIFVDSIGSSYCNVSQNQCNSNTINGINIFSLENLVLANNICTLNPTGIRIEDSDYVSISGNDASENTTSGIVIAGTSSYNIVTGNTCINNAAGYGIIIGDATCIGNIIKSNNVSGNNWQLWDIGVNSDFEYRCSTNAEIQDAIDSIAAKSGIIEIVNDMNIATTIDVDGNGDYIIKGGGIGTVLTIVGDISCFNITDAKSCILKDFKIDATSLTTNTTPIIDITEGSNYDVYIERINIVGDAVNGYGIKLNSAQCHIRNCTITDVNWGIYSIGIWGYNEEISRCIINGCAGYGIRMSGTEIPQSGSIIQNCIINNSGIHGIYTTCDFIRVTSNIVYDSTVFGIVCTGFLSLISSNKVEGNGNIGISSNGIDNSIVGNSCRDNPIGISVSSTCTVSNNVIYLGDYGIKFNANRGIITGNIIHDVEIGGIYADTDNSDDESIISNNNITTMSNNLIDCYGIYVNANNITIIGNSLTNINAGGGLIGYGIYIDVSANSTVIIGNVFQGCEQNYSDNGITTKLFGDDAVYGAGWNGDLGTATKNAIYDKIQLVIAGAAGDAFKTITGITNDVVADGVADILEFAAVGGLTIVGDAVNDKITFTNTITQYVDADADARIALAHHDTLLFPNGNANEQHLTAAEVAQLHDDVITTNAHADARIAAADHDVLQNPNGNANEQHMTAAQIAALHAIQVGGDFNHDDIANPQGNANEQHLTAAEVAQLHDDVITTNAHVDARIALANHDTLLFPNGNANEQHMTAAQIAALHAVYLDVDAVAAVLAADDYLKLVGDTMGGSINMGGNNITNCANATITTLLTLPTGAAASYWNVNDIYASQNLRIRDAHSLYIYSAGNDKSIRLYHNDTNAILDCTGDLYLNPTGNEVFINYVSVAAEIRHTGDTNNSIAFGVDTQTFETGGVTRLDISNTGVRIGAADARITEFDSGALANSATKVPTSSAVFAAIAGFCTTAQAHAYVEANALTLTQTLTTRGIDQNGYTVYDSAGVKFRASTNSAISLYLSATDHRYHGTLLNITTNGGSFGVPMYMDTTSRRVSVCVDTSVNTMPCIGIYVAANWILTDGYIRDNTWNFAYGTAAKRVVYVNASVCSTTIPPTVGDIVQVIGVPISADEMYFKPSLDWVVRQ